MPPALTSCSRISMAMLCVAAALLFGCEPPRQPPAPPPPAPAAATTVTVEPAERPTSRQRVSLPLSGRIGDEPVANARPIYRPNDDRPTRNDQQLLELGIARYNGKRLRLYTDIDPEVAATLPPLVDAAWDAWEAEFGPLPAARDGSDWQATGYLMENRKPFAEAGVMPNLDADFEHGLQRGREFWVANSSFDYYRRHLILHEATHCYMTTLGPLVPPLWYYEGAAEYFGTHRLNDEGVPTLGIMPERRDELEGWGRFRRMQPFATGERPLRLDQILSTKIDDFRRGDGYVVSWMFWSWLRRHPDFAPRMQELGRPVGSDRQTSRFQQLFRTDLPRMQVEWATVLPQADQPLDFERWAIAWQPATAQERAPREAKVQANRGWQSTRVRVQTGESLRITASGRIQVAQPNNTPWLSEANGISIRYVRGRPCGRLLATILPDAPPNENWRPTETDIGSAGTLVAVEDGTLYLRANDAANELADNSGEFTATIESASAP